MGRPHTPSTFSIPAMTSGWYSCLWRVSWNHFGRMPGRIFFSEMSSTAWSSAGMMTPSAAASDASDTSLLPASGSISRSDVGSICRNTVIALAGDVYRPVPRHYPGVGHCRHPRGQANRSEVGRDPADREQPSSVSCPSSLLIVGRLRLLYGHRSWPLPIISRPGRHRLLNAGPVGRQVRAQTGESGS